MEHDVTRQTKHTNENETKQFVAIYTDVLDGYESKVRTNIITKSKNLASRDSKIGKSCPMLVVFFYRIEKHHWPQSLGTICERREMIVSRSRTKHGPHKRVDRSALKYILKKFDFISLWSLCSELDNDR